MGSLGYSTALDRLTLGALFAPLSLLLALYPLFLTSVAALGPWAFAPWLLLLVSTLGGLELIAPRAPPPARSSTRSAAPSRPS